MWSDNSGNTLKKYLKNFTHTLTSIRQRTNLIFEEIRFIGRVLGRIKGLSQIKSNSEFKVPLGLVYYKGKWVWASWI